MSDPQLIERYAQLIHETTQAMPAEGVLFWTRTALGLI